MKKILLKKVVFVACLAILLTVFVTVALFANWVNGSSYVKFNENKICNKFSEVTVLDCNGNVIDEPQLFCGKKQIPLASLPKYVYQAFVAVEDKRFFTHNGIDVLRVLSATARNVQSHSKKEGASTLTQQLVKNTHLSGEKTYSRKINEMMLAMQLEQRFSKNEILEMYLNTIYFGRNAYGIETAANMYFGKSATELTLSQAATLAAAIKAPSVYAPDKNLAKCTTRRNTVLSLMKQQGFVDQRQYDQAIAEKITCVKYDTQNHVGYVQCALNEAAKLLNMSLSQFMHGNYIVETYCNSQLQTQLTHQVKQDDTRDKDGVLANLTAVVCNKNGQVTACCTRGESFAKRQVGSVLKPIAVYTPAFCEGQIAPASPILDEKTNFNGYKPTNVGGYKGWTTIANALLSSSNVAAVKTLNALTLPTAEKYLSALGYNGKQNLSLALGNIDGGMDELDLLHCYTALCNAGQATNVRFVKSITTPDGVVYNDKQHNTQVFDENSTYLTTYLLQQNAKIGTARTLKNLNFAVAAKTGTVGNKSGNTDAYTVGYTANDVFVVHYSGQLSNAVVGGKQPCSFAAELLQKAYTNNKPSEFSVPQGITFVPLSQSELLQNQRFVYDANGVPYPFSNTNKPVLQISE